MDYEYQMTSPEERAARREQRDQARRARRKAKRMRLLRRSWPLLVLAVLLAAAVRFVPRGQESEPPEPAAQTMEPVLPAAEEEPPAAPARPVATNETLRLMDEITSQYAVVADFAQGRVLAEKQADAVINPASMTKVLTVLVAAEQVKSLDDRVPITIDITDYSFSHGCSVAGFELGEQVPVRDLFYATILPSGADGALALANYVSGSQEAFVERMNEKLRELGLAETAHFTNCVGLYDPEHHCTVTDMAVILNAALQNELCREVLTARTYQTTATEQHPQGLTLSNWFLRRIEDKDEDACKVQAGKTGYVTQSGSCAASMAAMPNGRELICVTADAAGSWKCLYDHVALYRQLSS